MGDAEVGQKDLKTRNVFKETETQWAGAAKRRLRRNAANW